MKRALDARRKFVCGVRGPGREGLRRTGDQVRRCLGKHQWLQNWDGFRRSRPCEVGGISSCPLAGARVGLFGRFCRSLPPPASGAWRRTIRQEVEGVRDSPRRRVSLVDPPALPFFLPPLSCAERERCQPEPPSPLRPFRLYAFLSSFLAPREETELPFCRQAPTKQATSGETALGRRTGSPSGSSSVRSCF